MNRWWNRLTRSTPRSTSLPEVPASAFPAEEASPSGPGGTPAGGGWYESSWELRNGLAVVEETSLDQAGWESVPPERREATRA
jgi:hypothetical protein